MTLGPFLRLNAPWLAAGGLLTFLSSFGQTFFISIFAGEIRSEFGLSHGEWGGIYSLGTTSSAIAMIWAGALTDRFRVRGLGALILLALAGACIAMASVTAAWALAFVIFALRFTGQGMTSHIAVVAMARWFVATRGRALAIATLGFSVGEALLPVLFVALMGFVDWRLLWVVAAIIALAGIPVLSLLLRNERTPQSMAHENPSLGMFGRHWTRNQTLRHPLFWFMVPALLGPSAFGTALFFHQVHYAEIKGWEHVQLVSLFPL
jgi:MFS family permease